ncbi:MAG: TfoX/Sxy family protein [Candidatus Nanopelagicales bacterium]
MAYDEDLAARIRAALADSPALTGNPPTEKAMFGGLAWLVGGHMSVGVNTGCLIVRIPPETYEQMLAEPGCSEMVFTGRPMRGWVQVDEETLADDGALATWVERGVAYAGSLPAKDPKQQKRKR